MTPSVTRVAVVGPTDVVTSGLRSMLSRHPDRVAVVRLLAGTTGPAPHVVLYDVVGLEEDDGEELTRLVQRTSSAVLVVARDQRPDLVARALDLGTDGSLPLDVDDDALLSAVTAADAGLLPAQDVLGRARGVSAPYGVTLASSDDASTRPVAVSSLKAEVGLTDREIDMLTLITQGLTNQEIAERSLLSINSVKTYIRGAYRRIGVSTRSQAVVWSLQRGFPARPDDPGVPAPGLTSA